MKLPSLVPNWRQAHLWHSMRGMSAGVILTAVAGALALSASAASWISVFGLGIVLIVAAVIFLASMVGRLLMQEPPPPKPPETNAGKATQ